MVSCIAASPRALDTRPHTLLAQIADQLPTPFRDSFYTVDGLHVYRVGNTRLVDPNCTEQVCPFPVRRLLEGSVVGRAQHAGL